MGVSNAFPPQIDKSGHIMYALYTAPNECMDVCIVSALVDFCLMCSKQLVVQSIRQTCHDVMEFILTWT